MKSVTTYAVTVIAFMALLITGCAAPTTQLPQVDQTLLGEEEQKQRKIALKSRVDMENKLAHISYPLLRAAIPFCKGKEEPHAGFNVWNRDLFPEDYRYAAESVFGVTDELIVSYVHVESPAHHAGVLAGDRVIAVDGQSVPTGEDAVEEFNELLSKKLKPGSVAKLTLQSSDKLKEIEITPDSLCDYEVLLREKDTVNALADGRRIVVFRGMMRFVESDQELSLVVAHEIAHNAMGHIDSKISNALFGAFVDIVAATSGVYTLGAVGALASLTYSPEFEEEADYTGLYIMARAGLEVEGAASFWRKVAVEHPQSIKFSHFSTHPATPKRFLAMERVIEEIKNKIDNQKPLLPNLK